MINLLCSSQRKGGAKMNLTTLMLEFLLSVIAGMIANYLFTVLMK